MIAQVSYELFGEDGLDRRRLKVGHFSNKEEAMFREIMEVINKQLCSLYLSLLRYLIIQ